MGGCVLCGGELAEWKNQLYAWQDFTYRYLRCSSCRSLVCDPMPGPSVLARLYGTDYAAAFPDTYRIDSTRSTGWVRQQLAATPPSTFVDFGCGDGSLLSVAVEAGWEAVGVELDPAVAARARAATGCVVVCTSDLGDIGPAAVVHLGDVLEHLPEPAQGIAQALTLLAPDGRLLVQGPLEAGPSLFSSVVRPGRRRRAIAVEMPPYHLVQATARGQRELFRRCGLAERSYDVSEVDWPAPSVLSTHDFADPRRVALYALRQVSRRVDPVLSSRRGRQGAGNRFTYVGGLAPATAPRPA